MESDQAESSAHITFDTVPSSNYSRTRIRPQGLDAIERKPCSQPRACTGQRKTMAQTSQQMMPQWRRSFEKVDLWIQAIDGMS